ncbi:MAG: hypothetical protein KF773_05635 [Deltaproteobacteria bacterium]|nr:hypothetical protein [Deltaproteobacteria bacterium]MCW5801963.1 hypothetical protein [Deltaproteobacteria bacterium]
MKRLFRPRRDRQRGSAMLLTLIIITSLLAGSSVLVAVQLQSTRTTDIMRNGIAALYCAEAGLAAARPIMANSYSQWNAAFAVQSAAELVDPDAFIEPAFLSPAAFSHDLDGDGIDDFRVMIRDNDDEFPTPVPNVDSDQLAFLIVECTKFPDMPKRVEELSRFNPGGASNIIGIGGVDGNGNGN